MTSKHLFDNIPTWDRELEQNRKNEELEARQREANTENFMRRTRLKKQSQQLALPEHSQEEIKYVPHDRFITHIRNTEDSINVLISKHNRLRRDMNVNFTLIILGNLIILILILIVITF